MMQLHADNLPAALRSEQQAIESDPKDPHLHAHLSSIYEKGGNTQEALREARQAVSLDERDWQLRRQLATLLQSLNRLAEAAAEWEKAFSLDPKQLSLGMPLAICLESQGRPREAMMVLEQLSAEHDDNEAVWLSLTRNYLALGDTYAAKITASKTLNIVPTSKEALKLKSDLSTERNSQENAISQSRSLLLAQPQNAMCYSRLCHAACGGQGYLPEAAWLTRQALLNKASDADTLLELSRHFLEKASTLEPERIGGSARLQKAWWRLAEALLRQALITRSTCFEGALKLSEILLLQGRGDEALPFAAKACGLQPNDEDANTALKRCLAYQNDLAFQLKRLLWPRLSDSTP